MRTKCHISTILYIFFCYLRSYRYIKNYPIFKLLIDK
nr:MAG TPA: RNA polymerase I subunit [Caudoviricetes sp.]